MINDNWWIFLEDRRVWEVNRSTKYTSVLKGEPGISVFRGWDERFLGKSLCIIPMDPAVPSQEMI